MRFPFFYDKRFNSIIANIFIFLFINSCINNNTTQQQTNQNENEQSFQNNKPTSIIEEKNTKTDASQLIIGKWRRGWMIMPDNKIMTTINEPVFEKNYIININSNREIEITYSDSSNCAVRLNLTRNIKKGKWSIDSTNKNPYPLLLFNIRKLNDTQQTIKYIKHIDDIELILETPEGITEFYEKQK